MEKNFLKIVKPEDFNDLKDITESSLSVNSAVTEKVSKIIGNIREKGESAFLKYCRQFDNTNPQSIDDLTVLASELDKAEAKILKENPLLVEAVKTAYKNLMEYHSEQLKKIDAGWFIEPKPGKRLGQVVNPVRRAGLYVPGGRFIYPSTVLMTAVPAIVAGVEEIIIFTPPGKNGEVDEVLLFIFDFLGLDQIYRAGGAHAIAAMAFGTENMEKVDKIAGPGNIYVTTAKKLVYGYTGIDSLAGPSEILVIADDSSNPRFIASDLIAQAEHDPYARSILLTNSLKTAELIPGAIYAQIDKISSTYGELFNSSAVIQTLNNNCRIIYHPDMDFLLRLSDMIAPEHLEIMTKNNKEILKKIRNAGAIFIGDYTPVSAGDYICGTNHVIPTGGNARFASPLSVSDFYKASSIVQYSRESLRAELKPLAALAEFENMLAHRYSALVRFEEEQ